MLLCTSCFDREEEKKEVRKVWKAYRMAFSNNMGVECSKYVDSASIKQYAYLHTLALDADSATVERLRMDQKLAVLLARHAIPAASIEGMDGKRFFEALVQMGMGGGGAGEDVHFDFLSIDPKRAVTQMIDSNGKRGLTLTFFKEYDHWKLDLPSLTAQIDKFTWESMVKESGRTEHEFLNTVLEMTNNIPPNDSVWQPVRGRR